jgi:hypothetical protein
MYNDCIISRDTSSSGTSTRHIRHMNRVTGSPSWSWVVILSKTTLYTRSLHFMSYQDLQRAVFSSSSFTRRCFLVSCFLSFVWRVWEWVPCLETLMLYASASDILLPAWDILLPAWDIVLLAAANVGFPRSVPHGGGTLHYYLTAAPQQHAINFPPNFFFLEMSFSTDLLEFTALEFTAFFFPLLLSPVYFGKPFFTLSWSNCNGIF